MSERAKAEPGSVAACADAVHGALREWNPGVWVAVDDVVSALAGKLTRYQVESTIRREVEAGRLTEYRKVGGWRVRVAA